MTDLTAVPFSRPRVAFNLAAVPFNFLRVMASSAFAAAVYTARNAIEDIRAEFRPGLRYVLTGNWHDAALIDRATELKAAVVSKAVTLRQRISSFLEDQVLYRVLAVVFMLVGPLAALFVAFDILKEEGFFKDIVRAYRDLCKVLVTGDDYYL